MTITLDGATYARFTVTLSAAAEEELLVTYQTEDDTAVAGTDYEETSGTLTFAIGDTEKQILVLVYAAAESGLVFRLRLTPPIGAILESDDFQAIIVVTDDEGTVVTRVIVPEGPPGAAGRRGMTWRGTWQAGAFGTGCVVTHEDKLWIVPDDVVSTTDEPDTATDWDVLIDFTPGTAAASSASASAAAALASEEAADDDAQATAADRAYVAAAKTSVDAKAAQVEDNLLLATGIGDLFIYSDDELEDANDAGPIGTNFLIGGPDGDGLNVMRRISAAGADATLVASMASPATQVEHDGRLTDLETRQAARLRYLTVSLRQPIAIYPDLSYDIHKRQDASGRLVTVSAEMDALAPGEDLAIGMPGLTSGGGYADIVMATEDGAPLVGRRDDGTVFIGQEPAAGDIIAEEQDGKVYLRRSGSTTRREIGTLYNNAADYAVRRNIRKDPAGFVEWEATDGIGGGVYLRRMSLLSGFKRLVAGCTGIIHPAWIAQSNTVGAESATIVSTENPLPGRVLSFSADRTFPGHVRLLGHSHHPSNYGEILEPAALHTLVPSRELVTSGAGETCVTRCGYEIATRRPNDYVVGSTHGIGSSSWESVSWGRQPTLNLLLEQDRLWEICVLYGLAYRPFCVYAPHESSVNKPYAEEQSIRQAYQEQMSERMAILTAGEVDNVPMVTPLMVNVTYNDATHTEIGWAFADLAYDDPEHFIAGPVTYIAKTVQPLGGHYTGDDEGAARIGSHTGRNIALWLEGEDVRPFKVTSLTWLSSTSLELIVHWPPQGNVFSLDSDLVTSGPTQYGVLARDAGGTNCPATVTLAVNDQGRKVIRLAFTGYLPAAGQAVHVGVAYWGTAGASGGPDIAGAIASTINDKSLDQCLGSYRMERHIAPGLISTVRP